ncbi:MAG TPA: TIGR02996 domain-containing protein [Gemmataceae bacterium]|jgi:uncharacterized protein (TIGR02996 family)
MPTDADFLRAIVADPDADAPRLAYADWRDECGDAPRAEFVRAQCALAALPEAEREFHPLREREQALETAHRGEWLRPLHDLLGPTSRAGWRWWPRRPRPGAVIDFHFRRGFVEILHLDAATFVRHADRLTRATPLRGLTLDLVSGADPAGVWELLTDCPHLVGLTSLQVRTHRLNPDEMRHFTESRHLTNLTSLGLASRGFDRDAVAVLARSALLSRLGGLRIANLPNAGGRGFASQPCADLLLREPRCRNLESLHVGGMPDVDGGLLQSLNASPPFQRLARLTLADSPVGDAECDAFLHWLPPTLTRLDLRSLRLGDRSAASLARTPRLRQLRKLDLSGNQITDVGAMILADSPDLLASTRLDLSGNRLSRQVRNALRVRLGHHVLV